MRAPFALRAFTIASCLLIGCSDGPAEQNPSTANGGSSPESPNPSAGRPGTGGSSAGAPNGSSAAGEGAEAGFSAEAGASGSAGDAASPGEKELTPVTWKVLVESSDSSLYAGAMIAVSRGKDAAVAYLEQSDLSSAAARVIMQRFDATGQRLGALVELGNDPEPYTAITFASDGKQYAACWNTPPEIHCSLVDEQGTVQRNALTLAGQYPTLVGRDGRWAIAYSASETELRLQALTPSLEVTGDPVSLEPSSAFRTQKRGPLIAPTPSGFALVGAALADEHDALWRLDAELQPVGSPVPLGHDLWFTAQLAASDTRAAVSLSAPYGAYLLLLEGARVSAELPMGGGGKTGMDHALLVNDGGIGAAWLDPNGALWRRYFADGRDADVGGLVEREANFPPPGPSEEGTDSYQQLLRVSDQVLVLARARHYGYLASDSLRVASLSFP